jgi:hypothetical protein
LNYFSVDWDESKYNKNDNNRKSKLVNTNKHASIKSKVEESYKEGQSYEIKSGEFHTSTVNTVNQITSTLFLFSTRKDKTEKSFVLGPEDISLIPDYNYESLNVAYLLEKIKKQISNERKQKKIIA